MALPLPKSAVEKGIAPVHSNQYNTIIDTVDDMGVAPKQVISESWYLQFADCLLAMRWRTPHAKKYLGSIYMQFAG